MSMHVFGQPVTHVGTYFFSPGGLVIRINDILVVVKRFLLCLPSLLLLLLERHQVGSLLMELPLKTLCLPLLLNLLPLVLLERERWWVNGRKGK